MPFVNAIDCMAARTLQAQHVRAWQARTRLLPTRRALLAWQAACMLMLVAASVGAQGGPDPVPEDEDIPVIHFAVDEFPEGSSGGWITAIADRVLSEDITITLRIGNESGGAGRATPRSDYSFIEYLLVPVPVSPHPRTIDRTMKIHSGKRSGRVWVGIWFHIDQVFEGDETIAIRPVNPVGYRLSPDHEFPVLTIHEASLVHSKYTRDVSENEEVAIDVHRGSRFYSREAGYDSYIPPVGMIEVHFRPDVDDTVIPWSIRARPCDPATPDVSCDYTVLTESPLIIPAGSDYGTIRIRIENDNLVEGLETMCHRIQLTHIIIGDTRYETTQNLIGHSASDSGVCINIHDEDRVTFSITGPSDPVQEDGEQKFFTVRMGLEEGVTLGRRISFAYDMVEETATVEDFHPGPLWGGFRVDDPAEKRFGFSLKDDRLVEPEETFRIFLFIPDGNLNSEMASIKDPGEARVTIAESDLAATITAPSPSEVEEDSGEVMFTVSLPGEVAEGQTVLVAWEVDEEVEHAVDDDDYTIIAGDNPLRFSADDSPRQIRIRIDDDAVLEGREMLQLALTGISFEGSEAHEGFVPGSAAVAINDNERVTFSIAGPAEDLWEGGDPASFTISMELALGVTARDIPVGGVYTVSGGPASGDLGAAIAGEDFQGDAGSFEFSIGDNAAQTISIPVIDDDYSELSEAFTVRLGRPGSDVHGWGTVVISPDAGSARAIIEKSDQLMLELPRAWPSIDEGDTAEIPLTILGGLRREEVTVHFSINHEGTAPEDFEEQTSTDFEMTIPASGPGGTIEPEPHAVFLYTKDDNIVEPDESFTLAVSNVEAGSMWYEHVINTTATESAITKGGTAQTIVAASEPITVVLEGPPDGVAEGEEAVFWFSLRPDGIVPDEPIHLDYSTRDGTAEAPQYYTDMSGTLSFTDAGPQEVRVTTIDNKLYSGDRSFTLFMSNIRGGGGRTVTGSAPLTEEGGFAASALIVDDETPPELHLLANPGEISEAAAGTRRGISTLSVEVRGSAFAEARTVALSFGGDALLDEDYSVSGDSIEVPAGTLGVANTVQVEVLDDDIDDDDEWILVSARVLEEEIEVLGEARQILIHDDDDPWVTVSFAEATLEIPEGRSRTITARLDAPPEREVVIPLDAFHEGGAGREDYEGVPTELVLGPEDTEQAFTLRVLRDRVEPESGEGIQIVIAQPLPERVLLGEPPSVSVSFVELPFGEDVQQALKYALASFGRSVAMSTLDVIEDRFEVTGDPLGSSYITVGGMRVPLGALRRLPRERKAKGSSRPALREVADVIGVRFPRRSDEPGASLSAPGSIDGGYGSGLGPFSSPASGTWSGGGGGASSSFASGGSTDFASGSSASTSARNKHSRNIGRGGDAPDMRVRIEPPDSRDLLSRSEFSLTPGAADTVPVDSAWTIWGRSDVRSFDGNPGGNFDLDATTFSGHIGVDYRRSKNLLTGFPSRTP